MRISDWSSDVCSSDLIDHAFRLYPQIPLARNTCPASGQRLMRRRTMTGKTVVREGKAEIDTTIRAVLRDVLGLSAERAASFRDETPLFGALPELDSMAVAGVLTEIEDRPGSLIAAD